MLGEGRGNDAEHGAIGGVREEELVERVEDRGCLVVHLARHRQQARGNIVLGRRGRGPPEGELGDEGVRIDLIAQLARKRQQERKGRVRRRVVDEGRGARVRGGALAGGPDRRGVVHDGVGAAAGGG